MLHIYQVESSKDKEFVRDLFWEYLQWANGEVNNNFGVSFDIKAMLDDDMKHLDKFIPSHGRLLLAELAGEVAGLG